MEVRGRGPAHSKLKLSEPLWDHEDIGVRQGEVATSPALPGWRSERSRFHGAETHLSLETPAFLKGLH